MATLVDLVDCLGVPFLGEGALTETLLLLLFLLFCCSCCQWNQQSFCFAFRLGRESRGAEVLLLLLLL